MPARSSQLDLLRTLAIVLVFTDHFRIFVGEEWFSSVSWFGWAGVDLFFVLSGYLIASQLLGHRLSLREFYLRRGLRIWPNYFAVLAIYLCFPAFTERSALPPLWKFFTFTQNFGLDVHAEGTFSHAWSLCVEEQFYLILPLALALAVRLGSTRRAAVAIAGLVLLGIALRYALWQHFVAPFYYENGPHKGIGVPFYREIYYPTYCRWDGLALGVAIAALVKLRPEIWRAVSARANAVLAAGLAFLAAAVFVSWSEYSLGASMLGYPLADLGFGCLVMAALAPGGLFARVRIPGARIGATLAFAFYLTHKQMIHLAKGWLSGAGVAETSILFPLLTFFLCLATAAALYFAVERPFLLLRDRLLHERSLHFRS